MKIKRRNQGITLSEIVFVLLFMVFVVWVFPGCAGRKPVVEKIDQPVVSVTPSPTPDVTRWIAIGADVPSIIYKPITAFDSELSFIKEGETQANAVLKDPCFKEQVMATKFTENNGFTNAQIYQKFLDASPLTVGIALFTGGFSERINHTVAYEGNPIRMNRNYVASATYVGSASLHEGFGHGLGFTHYTPKMNPNSIPYKLNAIFEFCAKKLGFKIEY